MNENQTTPANSKSGQRSGATTCSATPETDENVYWNSLPLLATSAQIVPASLSRKLERERNELESLVNKYEAALVAINRQALNESCEYHRLEAIAALSSCF